MILIIEIGSGNSFSFPGVALILQWELSNVNLSILIEERIIFKKYFSENENFNGAFWRETFEKLNSMPFGNFKIISWIFVIFRSSPFAIKTMSCNCRYFCVQFSRKSRPESIKNIPKKINTMARGIILILQIRFIIFTKCCFKMPVPN